LGFSGSSTIPPAAGSAPAVVYTCDRHATLGTLPRHSQPPYAAGPEALSARLWSGTWTAAGERSEPVVTCTLPCLGSLHPDEMWQALESGADRVVLVACPGHDCSHREGARWLQDRIRRRASLRRAGIWVVELAPGSRAEAMSAWQGPAPAIDADLKAVLKPASEYGTANRAAPGAARPGRAPLLRALVPGLALLAIVLGLAAAANRPATAALPGDSQVRLALAHRGQLMAEAGSLPPEVADRLPPGVDPAAVLGGERFPVQLQLEVDGERVLERSYRPGGLRREGSVYALETWWLRPGQHALLVRLMDDGAGWRTAFAGTVALEPGQALVLVYDAARAAFEAWE
jgi:hypothetical protein